MRTLFQPLIALTELLAMLRERESRMWDKVVPAEDLHLDEDTGDFVVRNGSTKTFSWQPQGFEALCLKLRIPASYMARCPKWLVAKNANTFLARQPQRKFLVRFEGEQVRAVLSPKYRPVSHVALAETVLREAGDIPVRAEINPLGMLLQAVTSRGEDVAPGDLVSPGIMAANSECGLRAVSLFAMCYRTICENGLVVGSGTIAFRRRHVVDPDAVISDFGRRLRDAIEAGTSLPGRLADTRRIHVPNPDAVFARIATRYGISDEELAVVRAAWSVEPGDTLWSVIHACTRAGNAPELAAARREELQRIGGRVLELAEAGTRWIDQ